MWDWVYEINNEVVLYRFSYKFEVAHIHMHIVCTKLSFKRNARVTRVGT